MQFEWAHIRPDRSCRRLPPAERLLRHPRLPPGLRPRRDALRRSGRTHSLRLHTDHVAGGHKSHDGTGPPGIAFVEIVLRNSVPN